MALQFIAMQINTQNCNSVAMLTLLLCIDCRMSRLRDYIFTIPLTHTSVYIYIENGVQPQMLDAMEHGNETLNFTWTVIETPRMELGARITHVEASGRGWTDTYFMDLWTENAIFRDFIQFWNEQSMFSWLHILELPTPSPPIPIVHPWLTPLGSEISQSIQPKYYHFQIETIKGANWPGGGGGTGQL